MSATIKYKGNTIASITTDSSKTLKTSGKYCEGDIIIENTKDGITPSGNKAITATTSTQTGIDVTNYATVSVAPTPSETKSVTTNGDVTPSSGKLLSKVTVNVPTGIARDSSDLTVSGATVNVPAGLYSSAASKSVASGTAGTPTASKGTVSNHSVTVTPSVTNTEGYITGGTKTGTGVTVSASELVSGNKTLTPSETAQNGIDVTNFKTASVGAISSTYVGSGVTRKTAATVAPSTSEQTVCASGVYTTGAQKVSAITPSIVGNLDASIFAASIVAAVEGKGVTVPSGTLLDGMASLIESIEAGGGDFDFSSFCFPITKAVSGTFMLSENSVDFTINHNLGITPKIIIVFCTDISSLKGASTRSCKGGIMIMNRFYYDKFPNNPIDEPLYMVQLNSSLSNPTNDNFTIYNQQYSNDGTSVEGINPYNPFYSSVGTNTTFYLTSPGTSTEFEEASKQRIIFRPRAGSYNASIVGGVEYTYFAAG